MTSVAKPVLSVRNRRIAVLMSLVMAVALLVVALHYALDARQRLASALNMSQAYTQRAELLTQLQSAQQAWQQHAEQRQLVNRGIAETRVLTGSWRSRSITVEQASVTRDQAQAYLASLQHADGYLFVPRRFELKVLQDGDDLMSWTPGRYD